MIDKLSEIISKAKKDGKLNLKSSDIKNINKNNLKFSLNNIYHIDICDNKFTALPDFITDCTSLQVLLCSHNMIRCLPSNINTIYFLETLDLSCNHLTSLHSSICKLQCLKVLIISSNRLVSLPNNIGRLSSLEEFDSSCNSLTCLPEELSSLNRLRYLNLRHNKLLDVPASLHTLSIEILDLSENQLTFIPSDFHRIDTLQTLNLSGNPLNFPPANVCNKGLQHIMKYLQTDSKRLSNRNPGSLLAQGAAGVVDYGTMNGGDVGGTFMETRSSFLQMNGGDSLTGTTSTNSQHSIADIDLDREADSPRYQEVTTLDSRHNHTITRADSGYQTMGAEGSKEPAPSSGGTITCSSPTLNNTDTRVEQNKEGEEEDRATVYDSGTLLEGTHFLKNRNTAGASPSVYRSSRYVSSKTTLPFSFKCRRSSVPSKERISSDTNNASSDAQVVPDKSSQCVVVVDSSSNNTSSKSSSHSLYNQSNNSNILNKYSRNSTSTPLRAQKTKILNGSFERQDSVKSERLTVKKSPQVQNTNQKIQEKISKFHKIIEAQLHVHIDSKKLSEELSNGIYLCHLANILVPHSIPTVHTPSPGQQDLGKQKAKRNLDNFLEACRRNGTPESCLFSARDVLGCNPVGLIHMAQAVDALIESIRVKHSRPVTSRAMSYTMSPPSGDKHIDWHGILNNPHSLSYRGGSVSTGPGIGPGIVPGSMRSSLQSHSSIRPGSGVGRASKPSSSTSIHKHVPSSPVILPKEDLIQYSSEV